jgi:hypothetical protein
VPHRPRVASGGPELTVAQDLAPAFGKKSVALGIAGVRQEVTPLARIVEFPAVRLQDRERIEGSRQQKKPGPSGEISWQDLLFR